MAAKEVVNSHQTDTESVVNRWLVDYYLFLALEFFQKGRYADFCGVRDVLECVLARPYEATDVMPTKIRLLQFLTRINEGECIDISFETDLSVTPLESALILLENINQRCSIPQQDYENVCASLKEMMVVIFIKNNKFDKAKEVLNRHFPKPVVGKKAMFMRLISQNTKTHEVIEQSDFQKFKEEMLAFCQRLCPFSIPFLHKAAQQLIDKRLTEQGDKAAGTDKQHEPGPSSVSQINTVPFVPCKQTIIQRTRLEAAYKALAVAYQALAVGSPVITFAQLDEEVEREQQENPDLSLRLSPSPIEGTNQDSEQDGLFQKDSGSPMEASPADQSRQTDAGPQTRAGSRSKTPSVPKKRRLYTVARLVVEPDSQGSSQCTVASQELETADQTEEPAQSPAISNNTELQNPVTDIEVTAPTRKRPRRNNTVYSRASTSQAEVSVGSEQDLSGSVANEETHVGKLHNQSNNSLSRNSTKSNQSSSDSEERPHESPTSCKTPAQKPLEQPASNPLDKDPGSTGDVCVIDCSLDSSPNVSPQHPIPRTSSTPHKDSAHDKGPSHSKWKQLYNNAKESKDTWSDEESYFTSRKSSGSHNESTISNSVHRKNRWTESETQKLRDGVKKFGEGNWSKIKAYYSFKDRTNVNLKDRWRTMKKLNMV